VYRLGSFHGGCGDASPFDQCPQIIERDASVDMDQRSLNQVLELGWRDSPRPRQSQELPPSLRRETAALVWSKDSEVHVL
jgi:hypothetical protein